MRESKRPSIPAAKRASPKRPGSRSVAPPADLASRVDDCAAEVVVARVEIDALRAEIDLLRAELATLRDEVALLTLRVRKLPPPLSTAGSDEIIAVDPSEVVLESIRPPGVRRKS
jgi:hypothetical protein